MDKHPEEKKCSVCGRPNLEKANKCWYCQSPLENEEESVQDSLLPEGEMGVDLGEGSSFVKSSTDNRPPRTEDTTPEWLKKVRELIAADVVESQEIEEWQQQQLFNQGENQEKPEKATNTITPPDIEVEEKPSDNLPDGFNQYHRDQEE